MRSINKRYGGNNEYNETNSRNLVLSSSITDTAVRDIIESILDINSADDDLSAELTDYKREPIKLVINSFGGSVYDGFALIAAIEQSKHLFMVMPMAQPCQWPSPFTSQHTLDSRTRRQHLCIMKYQIISMTT